MKKQSKGTLKKGHSKSDMGEIYCEINITALVRANGLEVVVSPGGLPEELTQILANSVSGVLVDWNEKISAESSKTN